MNEKLSMFEFLTIEDVLDRCFVAASWCVDEGNDDWANGQMKDEFREVAREVSLWRLTGETKADLILIPMEEGLIVRHGLEVGRSLYVDFIDAFWVQSWTDIPLDLDRIARNEGWLIDWHQRVQADHSWRREIAFDHLIARISNN